MPLSLSELDALQRRAAYNEPVKRKWLHQGQLYLKTTAGRLGLVPGTYTVRQCVGGIGVAGEAILHHDGIYVSLGSLLEGSVGFARACKGRKDYVGGQNRWISAAWPDEEMDALCRSILFGGFSGQ